MLSWLMRANSSKLREGGSGAVEGQAGGVRGALELPTKLDQTLKRGANWSELRGGQREQRVQGGGPSSAWRQQQCLGTRARSPRPRPRDAPGGARPPPLDHAVAVCVVLLHHFIHILIRQPVLQPGRRQARVKQGRGTELTASAAARQEGRRESSGMQQRWEWGLGAPVPRIQRCQPVGRSRSRSGRQQRWGGQAGWALRPTSRPGTSPQQC